ncbi:hypothetical protein AB1Y20_011135 [Prymnesium parvum]
MSAPTAFRVSEKRFRRGGEADATPGSAIDFSHVEASSPQYKELVEPVVLESEPPTWLRHARVYSIRGVHGFRFICHALSSTEQLHWARAALQTWPESPGVTNLSPNGNLQSAADTAVSVWEEHKRGSGAQKTRLSKLAWATLGYHYQWSERRYDHSKRSEFPSDLAQLASDLATVAGYSLQAEAAIVNYYHPGSTMGGHRDDAEPFQKAPIVSVSLGLSAIFLLGGTTRDETPIALMLRSGDVIVQGGESRGYYHGVPRIFADSLPAELQAAAKSEEDREIIEWLYTHRINVNVRQVNELTDRCLPASVERRCIGQEEPCHTSNVLRGSTAPTSVLKRYREVATDGTGSTCDD